MIERTPTATIQYTASLVDIYLLLKDDYFYAGFTRLRDHILCSLAFVNVRVEGEHQVGPAFHKHLFISNRPGSFAVFLPLGWEDHQLQAQPLSRIACLTVGPLASP